MIFYNTDDANIEQDDLIRMIILEMENVGTAYERRIKSVSSAFAEIGGLLFGIVEILVLVNKAIGGPFHALNLGVSFRKL